jgi:hypothetical protein
MAPHGALGTLGTGGWERLEGPCHFVQRWDCNSVRNIPLLSD